MTRIAVIGGGVAGLACADALRAAGHAPVVLEKSRGLGGRIATRRTSEGPVFDHGAQFARARNEPFAAFLDAAIEAGHAARWEAAGDGRTVGLPGMSGLVRPLAEGLDVRFGVEVSAASRGDDGWTLTAGDGALGPFDRLVCAIPHPQALRLFGEDPTVRTALAPVRVAPCWSLMVALPERLDRPAIGRDEAVPPDVAWIAHDGDKPGRDGADTWVLHASPGYSRAHLEMEREDAVERLMERFEVWAGRPVSPTLVRAHRWRFAMTMRSLEAPCHVEADAGLILCGDWCLGARIEDAYDSGRAAARALLEGTS